MLGDWLGGSRRDGFAYQLQSIASRVGLEGRILDGVGYYQVWGRTAFHPLTIGFDEDVVVRLLSNALYPPGCLPQQVVVMLMEWDFTSRHFAWDICNTQQWCCPYILSRILSTAFNARLLKEVIDDALAEVGALEGMLGQSPSVIGFGQTQSLPQPNSALPQRTPALPQANLALPSRLSQPRVVQLTRLLLGKPRT
jgi:hypothetical protein